MALRSQGIFFRFANRFVLTAEGLLLLVLDLIVWNRNSQCVVHCLCLRRNRWEFSCCLGGNAVEKIGNIQVMSVKRPSIIIRFLEFLKKKKRWVPLGVFFFLKKKEGEFLWLPFTFSVLNMIACCVLWQGTGCFCCTYEQQQNLITIYTPMVESGMVLLVC
jgi:hypothetical protein